MIKRKIFKLHQSAAITLPIRIINLFNFQIGDEVEIIPQRDKILIKKIQKIENQKKEKAG